MAWAIDIRKHDGRPAGGETDGAGSGAGFGMPGAESRVVRRRFSPLKLRILAVNVLAIGLLLGGLLYLGRYQNSLIEAELEALATQGRIFAGSLAEGALVYGAEEDDRLAPELAQLMVRRLVEATRSRTRLFDRDGTLIADSRDLAGTGEAIQVVELPGSADGIPVRMVKWLFEQIGNWLPTPQSMPAYLERPVQSASDFPDAAHSLTGETSSMVWSLDDGRLMLTVAVPVQRLRQVLGVVYLSRTSDDIDAAVRSVRLDILRVFAVGLAVTVLLSIYLAGTIARPIRRLAQAADRVRRCQGRQQDIPDFTDRHDEIGDLSASLRAMTDGLRARMTAIERFAADVAHELKNPLSSLASAVETLIRIEDPARRNQLLAIIADDVRRLDRLITDISSASRVDAELSRIEPEPVDLAAMLAMLAEMHEVTRAGDPAADAEAPRVVFEAVPWAGPLVVNGNENRLVQVFQNLIANALSFSPPGGTVTLAVRDLNTDWIEATVTDQGAGIPPAKLEAIFDRFYSERPVGEKFGTHSGLGLSISRQIIEAHGGRLFAQNRLRADGTVQGAVFTVRLPRD